MKKTEHVNLGVYCSEELLLMDVLGDSELSKAIDKELDRRAHLGAGEETYLKAVQTNCGVESRIALVS